MEYFIAWWNLENLFDIEHSTDRPDWMQKKLKGELKGWNTSVLDQKIRQLASVIRHMNDQKGPDLFNLKGRGQCAFSSPILISRLTVE